MPDQQAISDLIQQLPASVHVMALSGLIVGVIVLLAGGRLVRPLVALLGAAVGAMVGLTVTALFPKAADPTLVMLIGAGIGLVLAITLYRFYMAIALALLLGAAAPIGVFAFNTATGTWQPAPDGPLPVEEQLLDDVPLADGEAESAPDTAGQDGKAEEDAGTAAEMDSASDMTGDEVQEPGAVTEVAIELLDEAGLSEEIRDEALRQAAEESGMDPAQAQALGEQARPVLDSAGRVMRAIFAECRERFQALPAGQQWTVTLAAIAGAILGGVIGLLLPKSAAAVVSSAAGAACVIVCGSWLATRYQVPLAKGLPANAIATLVVWGAFWTGGCVFQWTTTRQKPDD